MKSDRRAVFSWCSYDWANSAFTTLVVTFIYSTYFSGAFAADADRGTVLWSRGIVISAILIALLSPVLGAVADRSGRRRRYLIIATLVCSAFTVLLAFMEPGTSGAAFRALTVFIIANVAFEVAMVFYNAFLPAIAPARHDRPHIRLGLGFRVHRRARRDGDRPVRVRATGDTLVRDSGRWRFPVPGDEPARRGLVPPVQHSDVPVRPGHEADRGRRCPGGVPRARTDFPEPRGQHGEVARFLLARLIYNDGLVTLISFAGIFAYGTFGMSLGEVTFLGMALNVAAGIGAFAFGFVDDRVGGKKTVLISLVALCIAVVVGVSATSKTGLWTAGIIIGVFLGPIQSASRSLMGRFTPAAAPERVLRFLCVLGKGHRVPRPTRTRAGDRLVRTATRCGHGDRVSSFSGGAILTTVNEERGIAVCRRPR